MTMASRSEPRRRKGVTRFEGAELPKATKSAKKGTSEKPKSTNSNAKTQKRASGKGTKQTGGGSKAPKKGKSGMCQFNPM